MALIANHLAHDGGPPGIEALAEDSTLAPLAEVLRTTLRQDPDARASIIDVKRSLGKLRKQYASASWPLGEA